MKKLLRNRTVLAAIAVGCALIICFIALPAYNAAAGKEVTVVRVTENINKGTRITKDMIQDVKVGGYNLPDNVLKTDSDVIGKYAAASLQPEDYILSTKVSDQAPDVGLSGLNGVKQAVSVTIPSLAAGLSGKLEPGDIIELYVADYGDAKSTLKPAELQYVKLLAATTDKGVDSTTEQKKEDSKSDDNMPSTLTVLASPTQVEKLVDYNSNGKLHAALVYRGSETNVQKFLALEDQYLASHQNTDSAPAQGTVTGGTGNGK